MTLADIDQFAVPRTVVEQTEDVLRDRGDQGHECFVLWSGQIENHRFGVRTAHVPRQSSYRLPDGLLVRVEGDALHDLNAWLYSHGEMLGVQVHAHPTDAYHSHTDNTYPIITMIGGLSLVAPDFARGGLFCRGTAAYRLTDSGWSYVRKRSFRKLVAVA